MTTITHEQLRTGDIHLDDISNTIATTIDYLIGFAYTIAIIILIVIAYKYLFTRQKSQLLGGIRTVIVGIVLSSSSWFIVKLIFNF